jgi:hypothetical protein
MIGSGWPCALFAIFVLLNTTRFGRGTSFQDVAVEGGKAGFTLMPSASTGLRFTNGLRGDAFLTNVVAHNGAGLAIGDVDRDGWPDIYFCNLQGANQLYRNLGGWRFVAMDLGAAACAEQLSTAATFADVDGDGDLDLLVNGIAAGTRLFLNDGKGGWTEIADSGLSRSHSPASLALADIDGDGDLDLYCAHYIDVMHLADPTTRFALARRGDQWEVTRVNGESTRLPKWKDRFQALPDGSVRELPEVDGFYRNDGQGRFTAIHDDPGVFLNARGAPIPPFRDWGLAVMFRDINGDGAPDLYICNDNASPDRFWINTGRGTFRAIDPLMLRHTSRSSMGIDFADIDRDGNDDFFVLDMLAREPGKRMTQLVKEHPDARERETIEALPRYNRNTLFLGRTDGSFSETAFMAGVAATDWSWCPVFLDVDLDGYEDLLVSNGFSFDVLDQDSQDQLRQRRLPDPERKRSRRLRPPWPSKNVALRNRGDGTFAAVDWGFDQAGISYGMALGDLDNDGDLDLVVNNLNEVASLYRNDAPGGRVAVRLKGLPPNTEGIGARIRLTDGAVAQSQEMISGGRYLSGDQAMRAFAADAESKHPRRLEVTWRNGDRSVITNVRPNRVYEIEQQEPDPKVARASRAWPEPYFIDASFLLNHAHKEDPFDDWARQPLLPRRLSRLGPGVSWYDVDGDGWEDLIITGAKGGKPALFMNELGKSFWKVEGLPPNRADQTTALGWTGGTGERSLLVGVSNYELAPHEESELARHDITNLTPSNPLSVPNLALAGKASLGPMALADIDEDGDLDLFVGGRFSPGRYPEPVASSIWLNEAGEFRRSDSLSEPFASVGLASGATFCDLDGDGRVDLALAIEWGPIRVFRNENGGFGEVTGQWGFAGSTGWWTGITAGDFDGDGRMDLAAGNWGRNTPYELHRPGPLRLYYGDWNGDANFELIEAWRNNGDWMPFRERPWLERALPEVARTFGTHAHYAGATVRDILDVLKADAKWVEATELGSSLFLNRGSHFERSPLPREAQASPVFAINAGDFDGDGMEDLFLGQNFFGAASELGREDGGRGLWLRGSGKGTFAAVDGSVSGIKISGEQRGAALADFNHDGRVDLVVSQNNADTKLYLNRRANRGLRVVLDGPPGNPDGIGSQIRVLYADGRAGPGRAVRTGSGYWSQDGAVQVLGLAEEPSGLWIRWPGGMERTIQLEKEIREIHVRFEKGPNRNQRGH